MAQYQVTSPTSNAQYLYDGLGRRTEETVDGVTTLYLRNALGRVVDEVSGSTWTDSIIVPGAERMAIVSGPADGTPGGTDQVYYLTADQVGTTRVITRQDGTNDASCSQNSTYAQGSFFTFTPFGAELDCSQSTTDFKFTGKPRDAETGLDDFGARYNSSQLGRFMTPDWSATAAPVPYAKLDDPQSLDLYSYVLNNPVTLTDADGHAIQLLGDSEARKKELAALRSAVGKKAGAYLYDNFDKKSGRHFVGILSGGPSGKGPAFAAVNGAATDVNAVVENRHVVGLAAVSSGTRLKDDLGTTEVIGPAAPGHSTPGDTGLFSGQLRSYFLSADSSALGRLPGNYMSNGQPGVINAGLVAIHELGHAYGEMTGTAPAYTGGTAVSFENAARLVQGGPQAPQRLIDSLGALPPELPQ